MDFLALISGRSAKGKTGSRAAGQGATIPSSAALDAAGDSPMPVAWSEILHAFEFISSDPAFGNSAIINRKTGAIHWQSEWDGGEFEPLPEDIDDAAKYIELPNPRDL